MSDLKWNRWVNIWISIVLFIIFIFVIPLTWIMHIFKEDYTEKEIIENYQNVLYGSAVKTGSLIKFKIIEEKQPAVVAIGSSRVMQFRADYFKNVDFYTMGGTSGSIEEAQETFNRIKSVYVPQIVILGIDLWWLNPKVDHRSHLEEREKIYNSKSMQYFQLFSYLKDDMDMRMVLFNTSTIKDRDYLGNRINVGLSAAVKSNGFRLSDGSYQEGEIIAQNPSLETKLSDIYQRMDKGNRFFNWNQDIDYDELKKLKQLIQDMKSNGVHVVVFLPPFPNEIYSAMCHDEHYSTFLSEFEKSLEDLCTEEEVYFADCSNLAWLGASDNECIDGFHGSETAYARVIYKMLEDEKLSNFVNKEFLEECIAYPVSDLQAIDPSY